MSHTPVLNKIGQPLVNYGASKSFCSRLEIETESHHDYAGDGESSPLLRDPFSLDEPATLLRRSTI
jgi:hypothetical protein